nr:GTPase [Carnobacterium maltaromaticum]
MEENDKYQELFQEVYEEIKKENSKLNNVNILISGKSGVGKSTLINTIFGSEISKTGIGKPITDKITMISKKDFPINIYDTVGLELRSLKFDLSSIKKSISKNDIQKLIRKVQSTESKEDDIHVVWYAISGNSARIENPEIDLINWIIDQDIPVIIVLTKCFDLSEAEKLKVEITNLIPDAKKVISTLSTDSEAKEAFGIENLINTTFESLPEGLESAFVHSQVASISIKKRESLKSVTASMAANFGVGFSPVPGSDAPLMMASQTAMIAKITSIFGVDIKKQHIETMLSSILGVYGALIVGKSLSSNLLKVVPGLGTFGGGLISGSVGMIITGALGRAYIELMELIVTDKIDISSIAPEALTDLLISLLPKYLPKQNEI